VTPTIWCVYASLLTRHNLAPAKAIKLFRAGKHQAT